MSPVATQILQAIDRTLEEAQDSGHRKHLGASIIGKPCARSVYYVFRWAKKKMHGGRMLRLFNRGHLEEARFVALLKGVGADVWDTNPNDIDPKTGEARQWRISDCDGHFGGSLDGVARFPNTPKVAAIFRNFLPFVGEPFLTEFKTHSDKSFKKLQKEGVLQAKWEHFIQMQIYMAKMGLKQALYMAVNKNDDDLYLEVVQADTLEAKRSIERARQIIFNDEPPPRISEAPSFFQCTYCDHVKVCHYGEAPDINCRTCAHASPAPEGAWHCTRERAEISDQRGCPEHLYNWKMLEAEFIGGDNGALNYADIRFKNGETARIGPNDYSSMQLLQNGYPPF